MKFATVSRNLRMYVMTEPKENSGWKGRRENDLLAITYCVPPSCRPAGITSHHKTFFGQPLFCREKLNCRGKFSEGKLAKCWKVGTSWFSLIFLLSPSRAGDLIGEEDALFLRRGEGPYSRRSERARILSASPKTGHEFRGQ